MDDLKADAYRFGAAASAYLDNECYREPPDHPDARLTVRGGEEAPQRRCAEACLQQIHLLWPNLSEWGKA